MVRRATPSLKLVFLRLDDFSNNLMELHVRAKLAVETGNRRRPTNSELKEGQGGKKRGKMDFGATGADVFSDSTCQPPTCQTMV